MDYVIGFVSQKGGVGKSTLARAVAREFDANGFRVKLADLDVQQATTLNWHTRRLALGLEPVGSVECLRTFAEAKTAAAHSDVLVVDAAGRASVATAEIAAEADLVVQPSAPGLDDLQPGVLLFHELVQRGIPPARLRFALTFVGTAHEEALARDYLGRAGFGVLDGSLDFRPSHRAALSEGRTITETAHRGVNARADALLQSILTTLQATAAATDADTAATSLQAPC